MNWPEKTVAASLCLDRARSLGALLGGESHSGGTAAAGQSLIKSGERCREPLMRLTMG